MRDQAAPSTNVVKWEEKEEKLCAFVNESIVQIAEDTVPARGVLAGSLIARSVASPVVRALLKVAQRTPEAQIQFRTILLSEDGLDEAALLALGAVAPEVRLVSDERLLNANEQMVLGPNRSWIGDCMRRDPSVRDSYEMFAAECAETTKRSVTAFQRLWQRAQPLPPQSKMFGSAATASRSDAPVGAIDAAAMLDQGHTVIASTRH